MRAEAYQKECKEKGYNCAQIVFTYFAKDKGVDLDTGLKISRGFGGGMLKEDLCGCVTGAYMALGLFYEDRQVLGQKLREFDKRFLKIADSNLCKDIKSRPNNNCGTLL